jgi:hypothetical protein
MNHSSKEKKEHLSTHNEFRDVALLHPVNFGDGDNFGGGDETAFHFVDAKFADSFIVDCQHGISCHQFHCCVLVGRCCGERGFCQFFSSKIIIKIKEVTWRERRIIASK